MSGHITKQHIERAYEIGKAISLGHLARGEGVSDLVRSGMGAGSAGDYIQDLRCMLEGRRYTRTMSAAATEFFLKNIFRDYGKPGLERALRAVFAHVDYYDALGYGRLARVRQIAERHSRLL